MTNLQKKVATAVATLGLLANTALPVLAQTVTIQVTGNGAGTDNTSNVAVTNTETVTQTNTANIQNHVNGSAVSGDNDADHNTGDVTIATGMATTDIDVANTANVNVLEDEGCCLSDVDVLIEGNVQNSNNEVNLGLTNTSTYWQDNLANVRNDVDADAISGKNSADHNTGEVVISTLAAESMVDVTNTLNMNSAVVESEGEGGGSVSAWIVNNGADTDNEINLAYTQALSLVQLNEARLRNDVDADAVSGYNSADHNTGVVVIATGEATTDVGIDNAVNFNHATVDCGDCLLSVFAKIAGNVAGSNNAINAALTNSKTVFQDNLWTCRPGLHSEGLDWLVLGGEGGSSRGCNDVDADAVSGSNSADHNGGGVEGDPVIVTDDAETIITVGNEGNYNVYGTDSFDLPDFDFDLDLTLDLGDLLDWLINHA